MTPDKSTIVTLIVISVLSLAACGWLGYKIFMAEPPLSSLPSDNIAHISSMPDFTNLEGNSVSLKDFSGKVLVVNTWASWCPFCVRELPDFARLAAEYEAQDVSVLAVNRAESKAQIEAYLRTVPSLDHIHILRNENDSYYAFIGGFSMPETVFYDRQGNAVLHKRGFMSYEEMKSNVEEVLVHSKNK